MVLALQRPPPSGGEMPPSSLCKLSVHGRPQLLAIAARLLDVVAHQLVLLDEIPRPQLEPCRQPLVQVDPCRLGDGVIGCVADR